MIVFVDVGHCKIVLHVKIRVSPSLARLRVAAHLTRSASHTSTASTRFSTTWS